MPLPAVRSVPALAVSVESPAAGGRAGNGVDLGVHAGRVRPEDAGLPTIAPRGGLFDALRRYPAFRRLWGGALAASLGQWMQQVALGWLALTLTDSPFFVGLVGFAAGLPFLVVSLPGGALIDRADRRRLMLGCQAAAALVAIVVATDVIGGWVEPWHLLVAAFANGSLQALLTPTQQSLVPSLVQRADLTNAIGLMSAGQNLTRIVGPSIAGATIGVVGVGAAFLLQAAAVAGAFALVAGVAIPRRPVAAAGRRGVFDGIRLIAGRPDLRGMFLLACIPTFFVFPYVQFLPVFARDILRIGAGGLGLLLAASGSGAVVGALLTAARRRSEGAGRFLIGMTVGYGFVIVGIALSRSVYLSLPLLVGAGVMGAGFMSTNNALLQHRIADEVRGRVMGAYMLTFGLMPLGAMPGRCRWGCWRIASGHRRRWRPGRWRRRCWRRGWGGGRGGCGSCDGGRDGSRPAGRTPRAATVRQTGRVGRLSRRRRRLPKRVRRWRRFGRGAGARSVRGRRGRPRFRPGG